MYRKGFFITDDMDTPVEGWTIGENWNGFATPLFEREIANRVARLATWSAYIEEYDMFVYSDAHPLDVDNNRYVQFAQGIDVTTVDGRTVHVYPIGESWTWREVEVEAEAQDTRTHNRRTKTTADITLPPGVELVRTSGQDDAGPTFDVTDASESLVEYLVTYDGVYSYWCNGRHYLEFDRYAYTYMTAIKRINEVYEAIN